MPRLDNLRGIHTCHDQCECSQNIHIEADEKVLRIFEQRNANIQAEKRQRANKEPIAKPLQKTVTNEKLTKSEYNPPPFFYERLVPKSDAELENLGREMVAWAQDEDSLTLSQFCSERRPPIILKDLYAFAQRNKVLEDAVALARQIVGTRREKGSAKFQYNWNVFRETQPLYDPEYRAWKEQAIKLTGGTIEKQIVVMPAIPVPKEKK
jgi:hypothetical protein